MRLFGRVAVCVCEVVVVVAVRMYAKVCACVCKTTFTCARILRNVRAGWLVDWQAGWRWPGACHGGFRFKTPSISIRARACVCVVELSGLL